MANTKKMDYVVLGMLNHKSMTGYELKKAFDGSVGIFWSASFGSIYPTLSSLEKDGMIIRSKNAQSISQRETITYEITKSGVDYLEEWLDVPVDKDEMRCETLLKLFFCSPDNPEIALTHIKRYEDNIKAKLIQMNAAVSKLKSMNDKDHIYILLSAEYGVNMYNGLLSWCAYAREKILELRKDNNND